MCFTKLLCGSAKGEDEIDHSSYTVESKRPSVASVSSDKFRNISTKTKEDSNFLTVER